MRRVLGAVAAAVTVGVAVGFAARLGMALVAIAAGHAIQFSIAGTATILMTYALAMMPGAVAAAFLHGWARWLLPTAGGVLLLLPAIGVASEEIGDMSGLPAEQMVLVALIGLTVFATIPAAVVLTVRLVDRLNSRHHGSPDRVYPQQRVDAPS